MTQQPYGFIAEGRPKSKGRPRMTRRGKVYTPQETLDAERNIAEQYQGPKFDGPVHVEICLHTKSVHIYIEPLDYDPIYLRGDVDNVAKLVLDGLNGVAWRDDSQVKALFVYATEKDND